MNFGTQILFDDRIFETSLPIFLQCINMNEMTGHSSSFVIPTITQERIFELPHALAVIDWCNKFIPIPSSIIITKFKNAVIETINKSLSIARAIVCHDDLLVGGISKRIELLRETNLNINIPTFLQNIVVFEERKESLVELDKNKYGKNMRNYPIVSDYSTPSVRHDASHIYLLDYSKKYKIYGQLIDARSPMNSFVYNALYESIYIRYPYYLRIDGGIGETYKRPIFDLCNNVRIFHYLDNTLTIFDVFKHGIYCGLRL